MKINDTDTVLNRWIDRGYTLARDGNEQNAVDVWLPAWALVKSKLGEGATSRSFVGKNIFDLEWSFFNWIVDLEMAVFSVARENEDYINPGMEYIRNIRDQFTDESEPFWRNQMMDLARLHREAGNFDRSEELCQEIIEKRPEAATGYATLGDLYLFKEPSEPERAVEIYQEGLEKVSEKEAKSYDLKKRLDDARAELS